MKKNLILLVIAVVVIISCSKSTASNSSNNDNNNNTVDCTGVSKSFSADVASIIQTNCATNSGCHGSGSTNGPGPLTTYDQIFSARVAIRSAVASGTMPLGGSLSATQKNTILCWIDNGASAN